MRIDTAAANHLQVVCRAPKLERIVSGHVYLYMYEGY
jgi:hypothetical protein